MLVGETGVYKPRRFKIRGFNLIARCNASAFRRTAVVLWTISNKRAQAKGPLLKLLPFE